MKLNRIAIATLLAAAGTLAQADTFVDRARVQSVEPQYETVQVPREECGSQWVTEPRATSRNYGGVVIGAVAGGILGNQVGKGSGKDVATAAGVAVGAAVGDHLANRDTQVQMEQREVRSCRTVHDTQRRVNGYRVTYEYRGHQYTSFMRHEPGNTVPVRVSVSPLEEREYHRPH
jgi:uncharacterized protein YcfJ